MRTGMVALALGLLSLRFLPALPPGWLLLLMPLLALMLLPYRTYPLALWLLGFTWACVSAQAALDDRLAPSLDGRTLWLQGRVSGLPDSRGEVVRFELEDVQSRRVGLPQRIRVSWRGGPQVRSGERWRLAVKLRRPDGLLNPGTFDYPAWLLAQRIGATGTVVDGQRLSPAAGAWREALRQRLLAVDGQGREGALAALVLGDGSGLSRDDWQVLQDTGTVHLLVISGQHVGLLAGALYLLIAALARWGLWPSGWPWLPWACALAFTAALGYGWLAGFDVPVRRACIMVGLLLWWRLRFRHLGPTWPWLVALNGVLLLEPLASLQPGFWLSFGAVGVLLMAFGGRVGGWSWWRAWTRAQWLIAIGLLPALLALGLPVSLSGPAANLLAVPWVSLVVLPLALLGTLMLPVPLLGEALLWLAGGALQLLFWVLAEFAAQWPAWVPPGLPMWAWWLCLAGVLCLLLPAGVPCRPLGWPLVLMCAFVPQQRLPAGQAEVQMLDVGQGQAVLIRTRHHSLLYDAGPAAGDFDIGERVVVPVLRKAGVTRLDLLLVSHAHADHAGGAPAVQRALPVDRMLAGEPGELPGAEACVVGQRWEWDGVRFATWRWDAARHSNDASCVLSVEANGERLLLTGDIEGAAGRALLDSGFELRARWFQAPHHGSRTSSSAALLRRVMPEATLVSRGRHNSFGHPHPLVLARYRSLGITVHDTGEQGAVSLRLGTFGEALGARAERRFWRD
ncbi:DNA internalization-related competence protein ComEC/Rec2 [Pseudomonas sp. DTU_2021_1001937_2_SI_NGA_ILE_001]|uniref:DNA internalization-related competence protein ComEC/Rec2 n=1 Tax=Pseudomonas sp. DTU_2021_1001937_2_SI_NGA_ILE_001 TaxID=3077589 RepID=UPI0028FC1338|nr:DNA internalization-related competence protein ComEC/Rec2 [Pseudomonas sp. DTU_2021_1001937_2_SI_NGA_ILE_001]WNW14090.1 DNA internalization-related competence protein ComEC/Rec2 [Pseudomonas sp. DTU_2021_1001937_2_SI_NGA_ILE_001]